jgi:hypothetical protein
MCALPLVKSGTTPVLRLERSSASHAGPQASWRGRLCRFRAISTPRGGHFFAGHKQPANVRFLSNSSPTCGQAASYRTTPDLSEASKRPPTRSCTTEEDCRLDAEKAARQLYARGRQMYELRHAGFEWREIAQILTTTDAAARAEYSRELKRARQKLKNKILSKADPRDQKDSSSRYK